MEDKYKLAIELLLRREGYYFYCDKCKEWVDDVEFNHNFNKHKKLND